MANANTSEVLLTILQILTKAPESQLDEYYREQAQKLLEQSTPTKEDVLKLFQEIWDESCGGATSFVKEVVNPKYTSTY